MIGRVALLVLLHLREVVEVIDHRTRRLGEPLRRDVPAGVDLVALPTHGRQGPRRVALGSVTERVVHQCPVPALITRLPEE